MDIHEVLTGIRKTFTKSKIVEMKELGLSFKIEPLTSEEELKVLEACKDIEGVQYISGVKRYSLAYAIKKLNEIIIGDDISYEENGQKKSKSKFLYMAEQLGRWPSSLVDLLFEAYTNLQLEVESSIRSNAKFEFFTPSVPIKEPVADKFKRVEEKEDEGETETEKLNKVVEKELNEADQLLATPVEEVK